MASLDGFRCICRLAFILMIAPDQTSLTVAARTAAAIGRLRVRLSILTICARYGVSKKEDNAQP